MKFIARKGDKEKLVLVEGAYLVEKTKVKNPALDWKKRKDQLKKAGYDITVLDLKVRIYLDDQSWVKIKYDSGFLNIEGPFKVEKGKWGIKGVKFLPMSSWIKGKR